MQRHRTRRLGLTCACVLAAIACAGSKGDTGAQGTTGATGPTGPAGAPGAPGSPGVSTGILSGNLTYQPNPAASPLPPALAASNVKVATVPDSGVSAVTDAAGDFELAGVPVGIYTVKFSGDGFADLLISGVSVIAGKSITVKTTSSTGQPLLVATNPLVLAPLVASAPARFNAPATLSVTVAGGTAPYKYKWVAAAANPTSVTLSSTTVASPTFTTGTLAAILASGKVIGFGKVTGFDNSGKLLFETNPQVGFLSISNQQLTQMTYNFTVTVTDAVGFVKSATVAVPPATLAQGNSLVPIGQIVIANLPGNASAATLTPPPGSAVTLKDAATTNPWFIPDVKGNYVLAVGTTSIFVQASAFQSANKDCGTCHTIIPPDQAANVTDKFKSWANSAHGNHYFKYMHYEGDALVWNKDANGNPIPAPTANPTVFWNQPGAMTTYQFGMIGAEGTHYSASCTACHTTGFNALAANGGADDAASLLNYSFPNLSNIFGSSLTGVTSQQVINSSGVVTTVTYDQVTPAPNNGAWDAIPPSVKAFAGMQCESCHGPLNTHVAFAMLLPNGSIVKPVQEFSVAACAVCHDRPSNHDRVALWRQSRHANLEVAVSEGAGGTDAATANPSSSCNRCHSGQGFVQYVKQLTGQLKDSTGHAIQAYWGPLINPATIASADKAYLQNTLGITPNKVAPVTCAACHDPHTTGIRVEGNTPMLPSGFKVTGAGAGALCFVCHNSRNGAHSDALNGVYYTSDLPGATAATSIGAPHEANQGDVVAGKNAFFVGGYSPSPHLAVADSCVGCHMKTFPAGLTGTNTNHTWRIDSTSCGKCHGSATSPVDGEALQTQFDDAVSDLTAAINTSGTATVRGQYYKGSSRTVQIPSDAVATFIPGRSVGFKITTATGMDDPNAAGGTINTLSSAALGNFYTDSPPTTKTFDLLKGVIAKANWNYSLVTQDGSRSIHNPSFVFEVISETQAAVQGSGAR
jgi:hypothetical protein